MAIRPRTIRWATPGSTALFLRRRLLQFRHARIVSDGGTERLDHLIEPPPSLRIAPKLCGLHTIVRPAAVPWRPSTSRLSGTPHSALIFPSGSTDGPGGAVFAPRSRTTTAPREAALLGYG